MRGASTRTRPGQVHVGGHGQETGLDLRDRRERVGKGDDRRPGAGQAGSERARVEGGLDQPRERRVERRAVRLVEAVDHQQAKQVVAARGQPGDTGRDRCEVGHGVGPWHDVREHLAHLGRGQAQVRDEEDRAQVSRRVEAHGLDAAVGRGRHHEPAEERGGGVVRVTLDLGGEAEDVVRGERTAEQGVGGNQPADRGRRGRPEPPRKRDLVAHLHPPADPVGQLAARFAHRRLDALHEPVLAVLGQLAGALAVDRELDLAATPAAHLERDLVRERQRNGEAVEPGAEVGGRGRDLHGGTTPVELGQPVRDHGPSPTSRARRRRSRPWPRPRSNPRPAPRRSSGP